MHIIDKSFTRAPKSYIIQSLLAVIVVAVILYFVEIITHAAIVAALGSSAFIVFAMPHSITAKPRRLIGGACCWATFRHSFLLRFSYWYSRGPGYWLGVCNFVCLCSGSGIVDFLDGSY